MKNNTSIYSNSTDALSNNFSFYKSRGTYASPTVITSGDYLGEIVGYGYDGSNYIRSGSIRFKSAGTIGINRVPNSIEFYTSTNANPSVETKRGSIDDDGYLYWTYPIQTYNKLISSNYSIGTTSTDGLWLKNLTTATSIVPVQMSARARFSGTVWNTTGAGSSETSDWIIENLPISGTTPSSLLKFGYSANGGTYTYPMTLSNGGSLSPIGNFNLVTTTSTTGIININGNRYFHAYSPANALDSNLFIGSGSGNFTMGGTGDQGGNNVGIGKGTLQANTTGYYNTANGYTSLLSNTTGSSNTANGFNAGRSITTGGTNSFFGADAGYHASQLATASNSMALGYGAYTDTSNTIVLGNASITDIFAGQTGLAILNAGSLKLKGATSGVVTLTVAAEAGTYTLTLPTTDGAENEYLQTNGSGVLT